MERCTDTHEISALEGVAWIVAVSLAFLATAVVSDDPVAVIDRFFGTISWILILVATGFALVRHWRLLLTAVLIAMIWPGDGDGC